MGKIVRPPFPSSTSHAKATLDLVHTDLCGPMGAGLNWRSASIELTASLHERGSTAPTAWDAKAASEWGEK